MTGNKAFSKPPLPITKQVELLESRGMVISNKCLAESFLKAFSYYRFCGYALHWEIFKDRQRTHQYLPNTTFEAVVNLYEFDSHLRNLLFSFIENIEIAFRTVICLELSNRYHDSHWYLNQHLFETSFNHSKFIEECQKEVQRSHEIFIKHYIDTYSTPQLPSSWMMIEILPLGSWSKLYGRLNERSDRKIVSDYFNCSPEILKSWIHGLCVLRNLCAHHCRIWNRSFSTGLSFPKRYQDVSIKKDHLAALIIVIYHLLKAINKHDILVHKWETLLHNYKMIPIDKMGFLENWKDTPIWTPNN